MTFLPQPHVGHPTPVGLYPRGATPDGIQDLTGNVFEWCSDWYGAGYYAKSPSENPSGPKNGEVRVLRGGSWYNLPEVLRVSLRLWHRPDGGGNVIGFRCAREVSS